MSSASTFTRMGTVDIVCIALCAALFGPRWILLGQPIADWMCLCTAGIALANLRRHQNPFARESSK